MEIIDYLRTLKRYLVPLAAIPLLAAVVTASLSYASGAAYRAEATVAVPAQERSPNSVDQTIDNYLAAATTTPVLERVSRTTGVSVDRLREDLTLRRMGESAFIEVSFVSAEPREPPGVVRASARLTSAFLFQRTLREAGLTGRGGQVSYPALRAARENLAGSPGAAAASPAELLEQRRQELTQLRVRRAEAEARDNEELAASLTRIITERKQQIRDLNKLAAASQLPFVTDAPRESVPLPRLPTIARNTVAAAGVGLLIAIALVALLEFAAGRTGRVPGRARDPAGDQSDDSLLRRWRSSMAALLPGTAGTEPEARPDGEGDGEHARWRWRDPESRPADDPERP